MSRFQVVLTRCRRAAKTCNALVSTEIARLPIERIPCCELALWWHRSGRSCFGLPDGCLAAYCLPPIVRGASAPGGHAGVSPACWPADAPPAGLPLPSVRSCQAGHAGCRPALPARLPGSQAVIRPASEPAQVHEGEGSGCGARREDRSGGAPLGVACDAPAFVARPEGALPRGCRAWASRLPPPPPHVPGAQDAAEHKARSEKQHETQAILRKCPAPPPFRPPALLASGGADCRRQGHVGQAVAGTPGQTAPLDALRHCACAFIVFRVPVQRCRAHTATATRETRCGECRKLGPGAAVSNPPWSDGVGGGGVRDGGDLTGPRWRAIHPR